MGEAEAFGEVRIPQAPVKIKSKILHREDELESIKSVIELFYSTGKSDNLFILGKTGSGKTVLLKNLASEYNSQKQVLYIDCYENSTKNSIFNIISASLGNVFVSKGFASYEIFSRIREIVEKENKKVVLILDHFEALNSKTALELLCPIIGLNETLGNHFQIIISTNDLSTFKELNLKVINSLLFRVLNFDPHSKEEIMDILKINASMVFEISAFEKIIEIVLFSESDVRLALNLLLESERNAIKRNSKEIELADVLSVYERLVISGSNELYLSDDERLIVNILKIGELQSADIYSMFLKRAKRSKRQIRNYLASLVEKGLIEFNEIDTCTPLKPKIFRLKPRD